MTTGAGRAARRVLVSATMCDGKKRVLLIDDDHDFRVTVAGVLDDVGYTVAQASNGADALAQLLLPADPSLVLVDLSMAMEGEHGFLRELSRKKRLGLPVVVFSVNPRDVTEFGGRMVLRKPVTLRALLAAVGQVCGAPRLRSN
jgi:CheY-like chemotaxis protein